MQQPRSCQRMVPETLAMPPAVLSLPLACTGLVAPAPCRQRTPSPGPSSQAELWLPWCLWLSGVL